MTEKRYRSGRILIIDDNLEIHNDIKKIFKPTTESNKLNALAAAITGQALPVENHAELEIDSAFQGDQAVMMVRRAKQEGNPYALAYVDMRIPPGPDGLATVKKLQKEDEHLQYVIITAYSDHSWQDISNALLSADNLLVLKKPFEAIEIRQSADALITKWHLAEEYEQARSDLIMQRNLLEKLVKERTAELEQSNEQLVLEVKKRKQAEQKIRRHRDSLEEEVALRNAEILQQNRFLNTVINSLPYPFTVIDADTGKIAAANKAAGKIGSTSKNRTKCYQYSHGLERPCHEYGLFCPMHDALTLKKPMIVEHIYQDSAGDEQAVEVHLCPVADKRGKITKIIEYCIDITQRKKMGQELIKAKKMEMVAVMAGGISHDFNNLLMAIAGNVELALMNLDQEHQAFSFLQEAAAVSADAKKLTHKFLLFSRFESPIRQAVYLPSLITSSCRSVLTALHIVSEFHLSDNLFQAYVDPGQIDQAFRELFRNAGEAAVSSGGKVIVRAENICLSAAEQGRRKGRYIRITIGDEGCGILKEDLPKIFDPYFSRKARGVTKGMGLGLTIAASIISQHEGYLEVDSVPGKGTAVYIDLPAALEAQE